MKIKLGNTYARLLDRKLAVEELLEDYLTLVYGSFIKTKRMRKAKYVTETKVFYDDRTGKFPAGLIFGVIKLFRDEWAANGPYYEWAARHAQDDEREDAEELLDLADVEIELADGVDFDDEMIAKRAPWTLSVFDGRDYRYQYDAVAAGLSAGRGIIKIPTGGGKTEVACACMATVDEPWLFVTPSKDLTLQGKARFEKLTGEEAGIIGDGKWDVRRVTFATFQTLNKRRHERTSEWRALTEHVRALFVDECHTLPANTFYPTAMAFKNACVRLGLSATPLDRSDRKSIYAVAALGPVCYKISQPELVERGVLSKANVRMIECTQMPAAAKTWKGHYGENVVRSTKRNNLLTAIAATAHKPAIMFVNEVEHGKDLKRRLTRSGIRSEMVWGNKNTHERKAAIERLETLSTEVLVSSPVFNQGIDIPELRSVIVAGAGRSVIQSLQRMGRGSRRASGKRTFDLWDIYDCDDDVLERWAKDRRRAYEREGHDVSVKESLG